MKLNVLFKPLFLYENQSIVKYYYYNKIRTEKNSIITMNETENLSLVNLRDNISTHRLNSYDLFFKEGDLQLLDDPLFFIITFPMIVVKFSHYSSEYKSNIPSIKEEEYWESELRKVEDKELEDVTEANKNWQFKRASKLEKINELKSYFYIRKGIKNGRIVIKRRIVKNKLIDRPKEGLSNNLLNPHYYLPPNYNRRSKLGQLRHWNSTVYTFVRGDKRMNVHLDLYVSKLIKIFFSVRAIYHWIRDKKVVLNAIILKEEINRINNIMFLYAYNWFRFPLKKKIIRSISIILNETWKSEEVDYYKYMLVQPVASIFGLNKNLSKETYLLKKKRWMLSKPLFKHTSFNVIIDLFIFNNKSYRESIIHNLLTRRILYKYMYSMYANFADKVKASYTRPRFFYINIIEPSIYSYYSTVVRNYEKTLVFKNGIFKLYLYYFLIQVRFSTWKKNFIKKYNPSYKKANNLYKVESDNMSIFDEKKIKDNDNFNYNFVPSSLNDEEKKYSKMDSKNEKNEFSLKKIKKLPFLKKESVLDKAYAISGKSYVLLKEEREEIMDLYDTKNHWIEIGQEEQVSEEQKKADIVSWWDELKARKAKLERKARANELDSWTSQKMISENYKVTRSLEEISEINKMYLHENPALDKKGKGKKRRKQDEYQIWLEKTQEEKEKGKQKLRKELDKQKIYNILAVDKELLEKTSVSFEEIENEYYKKYPDKRTGAKYMQWLMSLSKEEFIKEIERTKPEKAGTKNSTESESEKKEKWDWNASLFNISTTQNLLKKISSEKYLTSNIDLSNKNNFVPTEINTFTNFTKFPLKLFQDFKTLNKDLSQNSLEEDINSFNRNPQDKKVIVESISNDVNNSLKEINLNSLIESGVQKSVKDEKKDIIYDSIRSYLDQNITLKNLWERKDTKFFNVFNLYFKNISKFESKEENNTFNKIFYSLYDDTKLFRGYGKFWYWYYFSAFVQKEFYKVNRDILSTKKFTILPRVEDTRSRIFIEGINRPHYSNIETNNGKIFARFWPLYYINDKDNNIKDSLYYNSAIFKPYYRYMIPLFVLKLFINWCLRVKDYSLGYLGNILLWNKKEIKVNAIIVSRFILVKVLLDLLRYNYRSIIRLKPKYYFLNKVRRAKLKYIRASLNHWISINRGFKIGRKSPTLFWHQFMKVLNQYYLRVVRNAQLDTERKILVPFVLYFEDLLFTIYGKWVLIRLWPLKRFFLSSYILANRLLMLTLWRTRARKRKNNFASRTSGLMKLFKLREIQSYYDHYINNNKSWPSNILNKFNEDARKRSLNFSSLESYNFSWNLLDRLNTYPRTIHEYPKFSSLFFNYKTKCDNSLERHIKNKIELYKIKGSLKSSANYEELGKYWLRPLNHYLISLRNRSDVSGIRFKLAGKLRHARSNDRSAYRHIFSGYFFGPRHTHPFMPKKIPLNVYHIRGRMKSYIDYARSDSVTDGGAVSLKVWLYARFAADVQELLLYLTEIKFLYNYLMTRSFGVGKKMNRIKYFTPVEELYKFNKGTYKVVRQNHAFTAKGKIEQVVIPLTVLEQLRVNSKWRKNKKLK